MGIFMSLLLIIIVYPMFPLMYYFLVLEVGKNNKPTFLGVTLEEKYRDTEEVKAISLAYKKELKKWMIIELLMPVLFFWVPSITIYITGYLIWIFGSIVLMNIPFVKYHKQLRALKLAHGWFPDKEPGSGNIPDIYLDLKAAAENVRLVNKLGLAVFSLLSLAPVVFELIAGPDKEMRTTYALLTGIIASVTWILSLMLYYMDKEKAEIISRNSTVNVNFERSKKRRRSIYWTAVIAVNTVIVYITELCMHEMLGGMTGYLVWISLYTIIICILAYKCEFSIFRLRKKLRSDDLEHKVYVEDDDKWIWGMLYYNPEDKHFMVEKRSAGFGTTINFASLGGKICAIITGLIIIVTCVATPVYLGMDEFTPISLTVENGWIVASQIFDEYVVPINNIEEITLQTELPKLSKQSGSALDNLYKGKFRIRNYGNANCLLNPENEKYLWIETKDGKIYLLSGKNDEATESVFDAVNAWK